MSRNELIAKIEALNEWERLIAEAQAEAEAIKDSIKAEMLEQQTEQLHAAPNTIRWTSALKNPFTPTALKGNTANCTSDSPNKFQAAGFPLYKKSPLPTRRPKQQAKS